MGYSYVSESPPSFILAQKIEFSHFLCVISQISILLVQVVKVKENSQNADKPTQFGQD